MGKCKDIINMGNWCSFPYGETFFNNQIYLKDC